MRTKVLLAFFILHSSFFVAVAQVGSTLPSTPFTRTFLRATNAEAAVATLDMTAVTLTNYAGTAAAATNAQYAGYATNIPWSAVTTAAGAEAEPNLTLSTLTVGDVVGGIWGAVNGILYGNGSGLTNISTATNTQGGVLKLGPTFETTLTSDANGLTIANLANPTLIWGVGGPAISAGGKVLTIGTNVAIGSNYFNFAFGSAITLNGTNGQVGINKLPNKGYSFEVQGGIHASTVGVFDQQVYGGQFLNIGDKLRFYSPSSGQLRITDNTSTNGAALFTLSVNATNTFTGSNAFALQVTATNFSFILTNGTSSNSVLGMVVEFNPASNFCYQACAASSQTPLGVVLDAGVAPGGPVRIADRGFVRVLVDSATTTNWPGAWIGTSATTAGRCVILTDPPSAGVHDRELGHSAVQAVFAASDSTTNLTTVLLHLGR